MKKKILILFIISILICGCGSTNEKDKTDEKPVKNEPKNIPQQGISIMEYGDNKEIVLDEINSIQIVRYTEAGDSTTEYTYYDDIKKVYEELTAMKIGQQTTMACEDNTTVFKINLKDGKSYSIEVECEWFVIGKDRYTIER